MDSRLEKMAKFNRMKPDINKSYLYQCEAAGLVVIDPDDEATIVRLAKAYHASTEANDLAVTEGDATAVTWDDDMEIIRQSFLADVRMILAALKGGA
jgi:hypothetical protein